jgi:hypothetical protein
MSKPNASKRFQKHDQTNTMKKITLYYAVTACCLCLLLAGCQKESSGILVEPTAKFTIVPGNCADIITGSNFFTGEPIVGTDSLRLKVRVAVAGAWHYNTDTVNGISFAGRGNIPDTGFQYISFATQGTPVSPGNFVYHIKSDTAQVNVYVSVTDRDIAAEAVPVDTPYFKITTDNVSYHITNDNNDPSRQVGIWSSSSDSGSVGCGIGPGIYPNPPGTGTISIQKNYFGTSNAALTDNDFKAFFKPKAYRFAINTCERLTDGFIVFWSDDNSNLWTTYYGSGQAGSYFKITGLTDGYNAAGKYYVKVKMRFSCKLYLYPSGQMRELTNGEMVAYFVKYE